MRWLLWKNIHHRPSFETVCLEAGSVKFVGLVWRDTNATRHKNISPKGGFCESQSPKSGFVANLIYPKADDYPHNGQTWFFTRKRRANVSRIQKGDIFEQNILICETVTSWVGQIKESPLSRSDCSEVNVSPLSGTIAQPDKPLPLPIRTARRHRHIHVRWTPFTALLCFHILPTTDKSLNPDENRFRSG